MAIIFVSIMMDNKYIATFFFRLSQQCIIAVCFETHENHRTTLSGRNTEALKVKPGGTLILIPLMWRIG